MMALTIAGNELRRLLLTPLAWFCLAMVQFIVTVSCFTLADQYQKSIANFVNNGLTATVVAVTLLNAGLLLFLVTPLLTMRTISEERRSGTLALLLSAPLTVRSIIMGKYLGMCGFYLIMLLILVLTPLGIGLGTRLDYGLLAAALLGLILQSGSYVAIGLFISTLTRQPAMAALLCFVALFLFWFMHVLGGNAGANWAAIMNYLSMRHHLNAFLTGLFSTSDVIYFLLLSMLFILLSILRLDALRSFD